MGAGFRQVLLPEPLLFYYKSNCFFVGARSGDHLTPFHLRHCSTVAKSPQVAFSLQLAHTDFLVRHFATTETQGDLDLVASSRKRIRFRNLIW